MSSNDQLSNDQAFGQRNGELLQMLKSQDGKMNNLYNSGREKQQDAEKDYNRKLSNVCDAISKMEREIEQYKRYIPLVHKEIDACLMKEATDFADSLQKEYNTLLFNLQQAQNRSREYSQYHLRIGRALYNSLFDTDEDGICRVFSIIAVSLCCIILLIMTLFAIINNMQQGVYFSDLMSEYKGVLMILCVGAAIFVVLSFIISFAKRAQSVRDDNRQEDSDQAAFEEEREKAIRRCHDKLNQWKKEHCSWLTNDEFDRNKLNLRFSKDTIANAIRESEEKVKRRLEFHPSFSVYKFEIKSSYIN